ncbi:ovarian tumor protein [Culex quinquefasciatus]|uniref:Ovarian tumor protein n=1 Tax=Culex quinquefasciatus TaxID=7176 RepID=B0XIT4_CULQU|nr:ovarian tumor protein [Culex quinquefasciatus]|eukprot:XP_001869556.1 ovarian tumor protein [Culex quinquefasciatus]
MGLRRGKKRSFKRIDPSHLVRARPLIRTISSLKEKGTTGSMSPEMGPVCSDHSRNKYSMFSCTTEKSAKIAFAGCENSDEYKRYQLHHENKIIL